MAPVASKIQQKVREIEERNRRLNQAKIPGFFIPKNEDEWKDLAKRSRGKNVYTLDQRMIQSGSNTTDAQFVSYRAIFEPRKSGDKFDDRMEEFGITKDIWEAADKIVSSSREFGRFIAVMGRKIPMEELEERHHLWPGSWVSVKSFQEKIMSPEIKNTREENEAKLRAAEDLISSFSRETIFAAGGPGSSQHRIPSGRGTAFQVSEWPSIPATSKDKFPDVEDESIVNTYAIFLLEQSSRLLKYFLSEWTMDRVKLEAWFNAKRYSAYTDGGLRPRGDGLIQASVEVKKGIRKSDIHAITKQETSQVVAMIMKRFPAIYNGHWLVVSLDRHEAYLNFSTCPDEYVKYIRGVKPPNQKSFLTTKPLGPWDIEDVEDIQHFVRILVAITLKANLAMAEAICKGSQVLEIAEEPERKRQRRN